MSLVDASTSKRLSKKTQVCHILVPRMIPDPSNIKDQTVLANLIARIAFTCPFSCLTECLEAVSSEKCMKF